jgi:hypothetical protein
VRSLTKANTFAWLFFLIAASVAGAVDVHSVSRNGRSIQLDGFLLEWKQSDARLLSNDSLWRYDVVNTREGLTGYFASTIHAKCGLWKFRFLPHRLSPRAGMDLAASLDSGHSFYRTAPLSDIPGGGIAAEWIIPWDSIWHDSSGMYQVGLFAFDTCGDTINPLILTGHVYQEPRPRWGGVYLKAIMLGVMMIVLYYLQQQARKRKKLARTKIADGQAEPPTAEV